MKRLLPVIIALLGLGIGLGAGLALKPEAEEAASAEHDCSGEDHECAPTASDTAVADPFEPEPPEEHGPEGDLAFVNFDKSFVVPVFRDEKVRSMVVISLSLETGADMVSYVEAAEPRLRDRMLKVMFLHSNSGGFDGSYTQGRKIEDLKSALLESAREVMEKTPVTDVVITEIARQDV